MSSQGSGLFPKASLAVEFQILQHETKYIHCHYCTIVASVVRSLHAVSFRIVLDASRSRELCILSEPSGIIDWDKSIRNWHSACYTARLRLNFGEGRAAKNALFEEFGTLATWSMRVQA